MDRLCLHVEAAARVSEFAGLDESPPEASWEAVWGADGINAGGFAVGHGAVGEFGLVGEAGEFESLREGVEGAVEVGLGVGLGGGSRGGGGLGFERADEGFRGGHVLGGEETIDGGDV